MEQQNAIQVKLDYYGNKDYGKRVYWIEGSKNYVWVHDFPDWKKEMEQEGYSIIVTE